MTRRASRRSLSKLSSRCKRVPVRRRRLVCFLGLIVVLFGACGPPPPTEIDRTVKIALSGPFSRRLGETARYAAELALEKAGHRAGPHTVELVLLESDLTEDIPTELRRAHEAVADPAIIAYVGPMHSTLARFSLPVLNSAGIVQISPSVTWPGFTREGFSPHEPAIFYPTGRRHFFRLIPPDNVQGAVAGRWAAQQGFETVVIVDHGLEHGRGIARVFEEIVRDLGMTVLAHQTMDLTAEFGPKSIAAVVARVTELEADLIFFGGGVLTGGKDFLCGVREQRADQAILGSEGLAGEPLAELCSRDVTQGIFITQPTPVDRLDSAAAESFREAYEQRFATPPGPFAVNTYEAIQVLLAAIASTREPTRAAVLEAVHGQGSFTGLLGTWHFDERGDRTPYGFALMRSQGSDWVFVESIE